MLGLWILLPNQPRNREGDLSASVHGEQEVLLSAARGEDETPAQQAPYGVHSIVL